MENTNNKVWFITAKTNLHVGNESTSSYGLIDKSVQRDVLTELPCINASSLKGALNEFLAAKKDKDEKFLKDVFGVDKKGRDKETQKGSYAFFDAQLLSIPVQSDSQLFYRATSPGVLRRFVEQAKLFGLDLSVYKLQAVIDKSVTKGIPIVFSETPNFTTKLSDFTAIGEDFQDIKELENLLGENIALFNDADFKELCDNDNLPIIARNKLDNGESKNLWYEQIVPQETIFYSLFLSNNADIMKEFLNEEIVQIGANATIGFGYCQFKQL